jgi:hypothetical protein
MIEIFLEISKNISNRLDCTRFGNCIHFAELFTEKVAHTNYELLEEFYVIEGYVNIGYETLEHTWIETKDGYKIDPTQEQFKSYSEFKISDEVANKYTGSEYYLIMRGDLRYKEEREKYPQKVFKYVESFEIFEKKRNHNVGYREISNIPDIYHGYVYLISDIPVNKKDITEEILTTELSNRPDASGEGEYVYQIKTKKPLKKSIEDYVSFFDNDLDSDYDTDKFSGKIRREVITQDIKAFIKTEDIIEFRLISGFKIYDRENPTKVKHKLSEETNDFLFSYIGGTLLHKKVTKEIEEELSQFKPNKPIKLYKGIEQVQLKHFSDIEKYKVGEYFHFKYDFYSSWTSNFLIAKRFIDDYPSSTPFVIESIIDPNDILVDTRMIPEQYYHTNQREIIVKKDRIIKCKIIWKGL